MPHKEKIKYDEGKEIEVITFDTIVHINQPIKKVMAEIRDLIDEADKYEKDGKLSIKGGK